MTLVGLFALIFVPYLALIVLPMSLAFLRGVEAANDPSHRATPQSPWRAFYRTLWRRLRIWVLVYLAIFVGLDAIVLATTDEIITRHALLMAVFNALMLSLLLGSAVGCYLFVPYVKNLVLLSIVSTFSCILLLMLVGTLFSAVLPKSLLYVRWDPEPGRGGLAGVSISPLWVFGGTVIATAATAWFAHRRGDKWFRFKQ